ncbi:MAG: aminotransferase class I/II-fold pyridoxal phosphate-dependent enzyme [Anaerofustis sp.]
MAAEHAIRPREADVIFGIANRAKQAAEQYGSENIINSTIGALLDDNGKLIAFNTVYDTLKSMDNAQIAAYAALEGDHDYLDASIRACFMDKKPVGHIRSVATPGGTGAVRHAVCNYTNPGDTFLTADWFWEPYQTIADENGRKLDTYNLFNEKNEFDFESYKKQFEAYLIKQKRILIVLNTPAHNPTGYTISDGEWDRIIDLAKEHAANPENKIIFLVDVAYIDFAGDDARDFMPKFGNLPKNIMTLFAFSASKSYTMYGLRCGAIICVTPSEDLAEEFFYSCAHSNRGTWSNGTKGAMHVIATIYNDKTLYEECEKERNIYRNLLKKRGDAFLRSVNEVGLPITNYRGGFFVSVPCAEPEKLCKLLIEDKLFAVPLRKGIRLALCAISEEKCAQTPAMIKKALSKM